MTPFSSFFVRPDQVFFTNSNVPYTNLTYYKAGNKVNGEERFKSYFSVNVNKRLAFGFNFDYLYGRGYYSISLLRTSMPAYSEVILANATNCKLSTTTSS